MSEVRILRLYYNIVGVTLFKTLQLEFTVTQAQVYSVTAPNGVWLFEAVRIHSFHFFSSGTPLVESDITSSIPARLPVACPAAMKITA